MKCAKERNKNFLLRGVPSFWIFPPNAKIRWGCGCTRSQALFYFIIYVVPKIIFPFCLLRLAAFAYKVLQVDMSEFFERHAEQFEQVGVVLALISSQMRLG